MEPSGGVVAGMVTRSVTRWFSAILATLALSNAPLQQAHAQDVARPVLLDGSLVGYPRVEVRGMTVYDPVATWNFALAHVLQTEGTATAVQMAKAIELTYREDGYFIARVHIVPGPQPGTAVLLVEEGHIGTIEVIGVNERTGERIASYMKPVTDGGPVRLADFERALMLAGDLGGVSVRSDGPKQVMSRASAEASALSRSSQSSTLRAIGPIWSSDEANATSPKREMSP